MPGRLQSHDAGGWGSSEVGTLSWLHHERAPHLPQVVNPPPSPQTKVGGQPTHLSTRGGFPPQNVKEIPSSPLVTPPPNVRPPPPIRGGGGGSPSEGHPQPPFQCNLKKNFLRRLRRPVFPMLFGPSDGPPQGGGGCKGGGGLPKGGGGRTSRSTNGHTHPALMAQHHPTYHGLCTGFVRVPEGTRYTTSLFINWQTAPAQPW